ncbi:MAG: hypothetical protein INF75_10650 [Roseomonas sp.]|nr:hypothetical protein [Roseomonas sp.]MCA3326886.1 hypothetical protein [Roseomonas sp.]MCA3331819.1 hypothetical protein [Roseomonas sp.]MCA3333395.1 hypothetical protein [Roseomonas sp.]MCA3347412.1 hypothetical protein [Roseomonas sp.]
MARALTGAFMLARGRAAGLAAFENTLPVAAYSFRAAAICLPIFLFFKEQTSTPEDVVLTLLVDFLLFAASWAGFALASLSLAKALGVADRWPRFIAAWNWSAVLQYLALTVLSLPGLLLGGSGLLDLGGLLALFYALWLEWFVARHALRLSPRGAAGFVALDVGIAVFLGGFAARVASG